MLSSIISNATKYNEISSSLPDLEYSLYPPLYGYHFNELHNVRHSNQEFDNRFIKDTLPSYQNSLDSDMFDCLSIPYEMEDKGLFISDDYGTSYQLRSYVQNDFKSNDGFLILGESFNLKSWRTRHPDSWNSDDTLNFIYSLAYEGDLPLEEVRGESFQNLNGFQMSRMSVIDFEKRDSKYGKLYFEAYHKLVEEGTFINITPDDYYPTTVPTVVTKINNDEEIDFIYNFNENETITNVPTASMFLSVRNSKNIHGDQMKPVKRGRPPKCQINDVEQPPCKIAPGSKAKHLWEFICQLLRNSKGMGKDKIIQWENKELGVFRIINSKEVACLWGQHKSSNKMTFEKLSRALRWCKTSGSMADLPDDGKYPKRLCFRFGPKAVDWRTLAF